MNWRADPTNPLPLHVQIEQYLRRLIQEVPYRDGGFLPDEVTLAERSGVSRNTIRAGILKLVTEGLVERRRGQGTRVARQVPIVAPLDGVAFRRQVEADDGTLQPWSHAASWEAATAPIAGALGLPVGQRLLGLTRVRGDTRGPALVIRSWVHPRVPFTGTEDWSRPLDELFTAVGVPVSHGEERMRAVLADGPVAQVLGLRPGDPALQVERTLRDHEQRPLEFAQITVRSDRSVPQRAFRRQN